MTKILILLFLTAAFFSGKKEETFEGSIKIMHHSHYDTSIYVFYVKDNKVRLEEYNNFDELRNVLLIDLERERVTALQPHYKVFKDIRNKTFTEKINTKYEVIKTDYRKEINGYECYQWRVRNRSMNTEIAYWVMGENFKFWDDLWRILNKTENNYSYFLRISGSDGYIPLLSVERTLVRHEKSRYFITDIEKNSPNNQLFVIPADYTWLQR